MGTPRDRVSTTHGRIIIAGTGRTGTTFLVQLFTALGFGTGYSLEESLSSVDAISHAGLERPEQSLFDEDNPYVVKSPWYADHLADTLRENLVEIHAAVLPVRDLFAAAESRRRVYREAGSRGLNALAQPGTLWHTDKPDDQEAVLVKQFYKTIFPLVHAEVPYYLPEFPRFISDPGYLFRNLQPLMSDHGVSHSEFLEAHGKTARPELVHDFSSGPTQTKANAYPSMSMT